MQETIYFLLNMWCFQGSEDLVVFWVMTSTRLHGDNHMGRGKNTTGVGISYKILQAVILANKLTFNSNAVNFGDQNAAI